MAQDLHCSPPANTLHYQHGIEVTGRAPTFMLATFDALEQLNQLMPGVERSLRRDAADAECPDECKKKTIGKFFYLNLITYAARHDVDADRNQDEWHVTIGLGADIDVMCEPYADGEEPPPVVEG